jgi:sugar lactone lactonase YvrE
MPATPELLASGLRFPEGPRWRDGRLYFSDIADHAVKTLDLDGRVEVVEQLDTKPSGLGWLPDGRMLIVAMDRRTLLRRDPEGLVTAGNLAPYCGGSANDMVVDVQGRAYVGNIGFDLEAQPIEPRPTYIILVEPDGSVKPAAGDVMCPNGMVITPDGGTLIAGESAAARLRAFEIGKDGTLTNPRVFAQLPEGAAPDGICLDAESAVWVASPTTNEFIRVFEGGEVAARIPCGPRHGIACMLGGPEGRTLFLLSNETQSIRAALEATGGYIHTLDVDVPGAGLP